MLGSNTRTGCGKLTSAWSLPHPGQIRAFSGVSLISYPPLILPRRRWPILVPRSIPFFVTALPPVGLTTGALGDGILSLLALLVAPVTEGGPLRAGSTLAASWSASIPTGIKMGLVA